MTSDTNLDQAATALSVDADVLKAVSFDAKGLVTAVVQDAHDGTVLMVAHMNEEALRLTLESGRTWFWSRSRQELWRKGDTSGAHQYVRQIRLDCDGDALVVTVDQHGSGACHTGEWSCFYRTLGEGPGIERPDAVPTSKRTPERAEPSEEAASAAQG